MGKLLLKKVVSGGQVGVDQAGILAAKENYFLVGGYAPYLYKTRAGDQPYILKSIFGLIDIGCSYRDRTRANVSNSDGTILYCNNFGSPGIRCTKRAISDYQKPSYEILTDMRTNDKSLDLQIYEKLREWLIDNKVVVLNIAGNSRPPSDIFVRSYKFFDGLFYYLRQTEGGGKFGRKKHIGRIDRHAEQSDRNHPGMQKIRRRKSIRRNKSVKGASGDQN